MVEPTVCLSVALNILASRATSSRSGMLLGSLAKVAELSIEKGAISTVVYDCVIEKPPDQLGASSSSILRCSAFRKLPSADLSRFSGAAYEVAETAIATV